MSTYAKSLERPSDFVGQGRSPSAEGHRVLRRFRRERAPTGARSPEPGVELKWFSWSPFRRGLRLPQQREAQLGRSSLVHDQLHRPTRVHASIQALPGKLGSPTDLSRTAGCDAGARGSGKARLRCLYGEGVVARAHGGAGGRSRGSRRIVAGEVSLARWRSCGRRRVEAHGDEDVADGLELGNEGDHAERPSARTAQDVDRIDTF